MDFYHFDFPSSLIPDYWVINYNQYDYICELLPVYPASDCMDPPSVSSKFTMRVLGACDGAPPEVQNASQLGYADTSGDFIWVPLHLDPFSDAGIEGKRTIPECCSKICNFSYFPQSSGD